MIATEYDELDRELGELSGDPGPGQKKSGLRLLPIAVGVVSLLTLGGIIWYAYSQGVREGSETAAPLLTPEGDAKETPLDPGGREISGTELGIYDRVSGDQGTTASVERILPPPEEPRTPPAEILQDAPAGTPNKAPAAPVPPSPPPAVGEGATSTEQTARAPVPAPEPVLEEPTAPPPTVGSETEQVAAAPVQPEPPKPETATPPAAPAQSAPTTPASSAGNGWRIQIAALRSEADARAEWSKKQSANPDLLGNLAVQIQEATVNGTTYYRIRGGPLSDGAAAKALCAQMKAKSLACIPVAPGK